MVSVPAGLAHTYIVTLAPQLPEGVDVEPGPFVPRGVQGHTHGVLLQQRRQPLVDGQVLVAFYMQQLQGKMSTSACILGLLRWLCP